VTHRISGGSAVRCIGWFCERRKGDMSNEIQPSKELEGLYQRIRLGGDDAIKAAEELWKSREDILFYMTDAFTRARWVPVCERLPDVDALVIACVNGRHVTALRRHKQEGFWQHEDGDIDQINVTHWMGLPAPPSDDK
jgi:hypothetical protein